MHRRPLEHDRKLAVHDEASTPPGSELLVAIDRTADSERALPVAIALARWLGASLRLTQIVPVPLDVTTGWGALLGGTTTVPSADDAESRALQALAEWLQLTTGVPVCATTSPGAHVADRLIELAREQRPGAIVVRAHAHGTLARAVFGSVTTRLLQHSPVPVVIVPAHAPPDVGDVAGAGVDEAATAWAARHQPDGGWTVVVTLDGTPASEQIVEHLEVLATAGGAHLALTYVATPDSPDRDGEETRLAALADRLDERGWSVSTSTVDTIDVADGLAMIASERGAAMIALSDAGHGILHGLAFRKTTDRIARTAELPLWVVSRAMLRERASD